ncbi:uncharacterized protein LOC127355047 isoform X4 [Dicentrarchus labrax]|uniref:uncharacterized protein LOC127355047 isoform X4 n=1 Tax=Dicentrarchus labrax TaxID=13489 RepID=UPI0021F658B3|nr:uncharacterized protein LOC127355047 isoform X4 [Dicentrarchus labrax]
MAGLSWMAVTLVLSLSAGNSLAVVDQNKLAKIVSKIVNRYRPHYEVNGKRRSPMFSLAVTVPYNRESSKYDTDRLTDSAVDVRNTIVDCDVYTGTRMVAATVLRWDNVLDQCPDRPVQWKDVLRKCRRRSMTWAELDKMRQDRRTEEQCRTAVWEGRADHAEYRTLQHFNNLVNNRNENDLLLFYVLAAPCDQKCASNGRFGILESIKEIKKWKNYAVVFSNVFRPRDGEPIPEGNRMALEKLGNSVGLSNIFRCNIEDTPECRSCSAGNKVDPYCFADDSQSGFNLPQRGRSDYRSQSGDRHRHKDRKVGGFETGESWGRSGRVSKHRAVGKSRRRSKDRRDNKSRDRSKIRRESRKRKRSKDRRDSRSRDRSKIRRESRKRKRSKDRRDSSSRGGGQ